MRIILVEDNLNAMELANSLRGKGYYVRWCDNVADAETYICGENGEEPFDAIILDLSLEARFLDDRLKAECRQKSVGWVFYEHVLKEIDIKLYESVIFYSGYPEIFRRDAGTRARTLHFVEKIDPNASIKIEDMLRALSEIRREECSY